MKKMIRALFWGLVFVLLLGGIDQFFCRTSFEAPLLGNVRTFYLDFRQRLLGLVGSPEPKTVEQSIEQSATPAAATASPRYVYADASGNLQFADSLEEVPQQYRSEAEALEE